MQGIMSYLSQIFDELPLACFVYFNIFQLQSLESPLYYVTYVLVDSQLLTL